MPGVNSSGNPENHRFAGMRFTSPICTPVFAASA